MRTEKKRHALAPDRAQHPPRNVRRHDAASSREPAAHTADELQHYHAKRDFALTPEPRGRVRHARGSGRFVVQMHAARRLHYDFRLELDGTLKSWAVPKGPSLNPHDKRLAVHVEDHPLEYASFEGEIPPEQYGAGRVAVWDEGTWEPKGDACADYQAGRLKFELHGHKLRGGWTLVRMGKPAADGKENWLLIKERDTEARSDEQADITAREPRSVASGRLLEEIGGPGEAVWNSNREPQAPPAQRLRTQHKARPTGRSAMPQLLEPQLASLVESPPSDDDWVYEIKFDGYRMLSRIADGKVRIFTRNGQDWTARLPDIVRALQALPLEEAWLDGEIAVPDQEGRTDFQRLQRALASHEPVGILYYLFDILHVDGENLRTNALHERKARLAKVLAAAPHTSVLHFSEHVQGPGQSVFEQACMHGLEGLIGKRCNATYTAGRSRTWIKLKCRHRQEFVIGGYTPPSASRKGLGALLIGLQDEQGRLQYAGKVGTGFDDKLLVEFAARLKQLEQRITPFAQPPRGADARKAHWVQPKLVGEVSFTGWTEDHLVRHASFEGLREDKPASAVVQETPAPIPAARAPQRAKRIAAAKPATVEVAGIPVSHAGRVIFPSVGLTKGDIAAYYALVGEWMLPHVQKRPLALVRCPSGTTGQCFFQKHLHDALPAELETIDIQETKGLGTYVVANSVAAVVRLVQLGVVELHTWSSSVSNLERPDRMIFDLDPDPQLPWSRVVEGAHLTRALLHELELTSFAKSTGGKGLHVVVPLARRHSWDEVKNFARAVAEHMARVLPGQFTANMSKSHRDGRIFVDYLRNGRGATAVAAFSARARPGATVSVPLAWEEVAANVHADAFTVASVPGRLRELRADPWAEYWNLHQCITAAMKASIGGPVDAG